LLLWQVLGVCGFSLAVLLAVWEDAGLVRWLLLALVLGSLWTAAIGWSQVKFGGMDATEEFVKTQARQAGTTVSGGMLNKLSQRRAFGSFVYPNSYAAHLILVAPLVLLLLWRSGARVEPVRVSRWLFLGLGLVLLGGAFWMSESRSAIVGLAGGLGLGMLRIPSLRRWRLPLVVLCMFAGLLMVLALTRGRSFASLEARAIYYRAQLEMVAMHPWTGVGLGEFFPYYMKLKPAGAEETRQPHCILLGFAAQAGILAGLAVLALFFIPLLGGALLRRGGFKLDSGRLLCVEIGVVSWLLHSMLDFNIQIPGTVMLVAALPLLAVRSGAGETAPRMAGGLRVGLLVVALAMLAGIWRLPGERAFALLFNAQQQRGVSLTRLQAMAQKASDLLPQSPYPWMLLGRMAEHRGDAERAAFAFRKASERVPHRSSNYLHQAANLLAQGRREEARNAMIVALEWYPLNPKNLPLARELKLLDPPLEK
jgi:tetratricopeptide (TPR) repeat protein